MHMFLIFAEDPADDNHLSVYFCQARNTTEVCALFAAAEYTEGLTITQIVSAPTIQAAPPRMIPWENIKDGAWRERMLSR